MLGRVESKFVAFIFWRFVWIRADGQDVRLIQCIDDCFTGSYKKDKE